LIAICVYNGARRFDGQPPPRGSWPNLLIPRPSYVDWRIPRAAMRKAARQSPPHY